MSFSGKLIGFLTLGAVVLIRVEAWTPNFSGGIQMGYTLGQNGQGWPNTREAPLKNENRGGFYLNQFRLRTDLQFDSTFSGVVLGNLMGADLLEAFLEKRWRDYRFRAGKMRGAGLKSASGTDEFGLVPVVRPAYARVWENDKRLNNFRDYGLEVERFFLDGDLSTRLFFHNANRQWVVPEQPNWPAGPPTQASGVDLAFDWTFSPYSTFGGHAGALANKEWEEFFGRHGWWKATYWFKSNPITDFSAYHRFDFLRLSLMNEFVLLWNRQVPAGIDPFKTWGVSSLLRLRHNARLDSYYRYEFFDRTDGYIPDDALHLMTLGLVFQPSPLAYSGLKVTMEYQRVNEEGFQHLANNDSFILQLQHSF